GYLPICTLRHRALAPLELVLDNFSEIEHTPTTHAAFGFDLDRMSEVKVRCEATETTVRVMNTGPCKPVGPLLDFLIGIRKGYWFNSNWTTYFSPVYMAIDHWWSDPVTAREAKVRWRVYVFFTPIDATQTEIMTFAFGKSKWPGPAGALRLFRWLMRQHLTKEIGFDLDILNGLASYETSIEGMKLSRFDRVLGLNRERIQRIYRYGRFSNDTSTEANQILAQEQESGAPGPRSPQNLSVIIRRHSAKVISMSWAAPSCSGGESVTWRSPFFTSRTLSGQMP